MLSLNAGQLVCIYAGEVTRRQWQSPAKITDSWFIRGLRSRCPACGEGHLFRAFMKVADHCEKCGEPFRYHRADDFPAYLVIVLVGHLVLPLVLYVEIGFSPPYWVNESTNSR